MNEADSSRRRYPFLCQANEPGEPKLISMELPIFRYSPNAYKIDVFEEVEGVCSVCHQQRHTKYSGSFYSTEEPDYICPWCISDGSAAQKFDGEFNDEAGIEIPPDHGKDDHATARFEEGLSAVARRTPGYNSLQQEVWLSHCMEPCAFIGYADRNAIIPIMAELEADIEEAGYDTDLFVKQLSRPGSVTGYLFQCLHCGTHRLHLDNN